MHRRGRSPTLGQCYCLELAKDSEAQGAAHEQKVCRALLGEAVGEPMGGQNAVLKRKVVVPRFGCPEQPPSSRRSDAPQGVSSWREAEFNTWLEQKLASERAAVVSKLQKAMSKHLASHHEALVQEVEKLQLPAARRIQSEPGRFRAAAEQRPSPVRSIPRSMSSRSEQELLKEEPVEAPTSGRSAARKAYKSLYIHDLAYGSRSFLHNHSACGLGCLQNFVGSASFEVMSCVLIALNVLMMALEVQYIGVSVGHDLNHPDCPRAPTQLWPGITEFFTISTVVFATCFLVEFCLRCLYLGPKAALRSCWMWLDLAVLVFGIMDAVNRMGSSMDVNINPTVMRTGRIVRMARMLKVLRTKDAFHTAFLLVKSLTASRHALIWSVLLLYFTMMSVGVMMNQLIYGYLVDASIDEKDRREVFEYYGTYTRLLITMFELTLGNWAPPSRLLMERVSQWWGLFIVLYRCVLCFSLVNVTGAVFITETNRVANDEQVQIMRKQRLEKKNARVLQELFMEIDQSGDGYVTIDEFKAVLRDKVMKNLLELMELEVRDVEELFTLMSNGQGKVQMDVFIQGILSLRGHAKNSVQMTMMKLVRTMDAKIDRVCKAVSAGEPAARNGTSSRNSLSSHKNVFS
mmetsp:Transcript_45321/g.142160  ORF Transcript_45321/g.142160 Transcript_45321/m.142160 type:complete len:631 (+) Transcript_45321:97-1989(+)